MGKIFVEENGRYCIDCTNALWATDRMNVEYHKAGIHISDVDFIDAVSIQEWNENEVYGQYPIKILENNSL